MTWKLYALSSSGVLVVTYLLSASNLARDPGTTTPAPPALDAADDAVDLGKQADRLRTRLTSTPPYREPVRNAFQFGGTRRRVVESSPDAVVDLPPLVPLPIRPPYGLAGMASSTTDGVQQRTAILSSLEGGVVLAREGDVLDGRFRVVAVADDAVTLETIADGSTSVLRFAN